jgi:hypothetical protein
MYATSDENSLFRVLLLLINLRIELLLVRVSRLALDIFPSRLILLIFAALLTLLVPQWLLLLINLRIIPFLIWISRLTLDIFSSRLILLISACRLVPLIPRWLLLVARLRLLCPHISRPSCTRGLVPVSSACPSCASASARVESSSGFVPSCGACTCTANLRHPLRRLHPPTGCYFVVLGLAASDRINSAQECTPNVIANTYVSS